MAFEYEYPRAALTLDCVVFGLDDADLQVLLIQRDLEPFQGCWALPGGFLRLDEELEEGARRELKEETGLHPPFLEQLCTIGTIARDSRERVVTIAYFALVNIRDHAIRAATDARAAAWFSVEDLPTLAFDHASIVAQAHERLRGKLTYCPIGFELLPPRFPLSQLQQVYETILERKLDRRNFRRKILSFGFIVETDEVQQDVAHRAARLYAFDRDAYQRMSEQGLLFEI
jgi:8-oxo-dGTP diphosphatase